ncbi:MAG: peptide chain release factor 2 [Erysipelotrichaceae bacterium]|nr:peptide chain release factor 2 [Erysipelotrichaceae bacterium]MDD3809701.1 peptide chain release factor 2 [Erysipelotrichaceae bacterium]
MEMFEIRNGLDQAHILCDKLKDSLDIDGLSREIEGLEVATMDANFWSDPVQAQKIETKLRAMQKKYQSYDDLVTTLVSLEDVYELLTLEDDPDFKAALENDYLEFAKKLHDFENELLLSGEHDAGDAIVEIHPGAGGTESQDWASMLLRMYQRYADKKDFKVEILDYLPGEVAGVKSVTFKVSGYNAYGLFKGEKGVHRLVRISPFDSAKRRHTSFASVDVMPEISQDIQIDINPADLRIDTYRSSGAGGQHVNTTDSAVRITHIPTNIVVASQAQRSQIKNRETAMMMLKSKLYEAMLEQQADQIDKLRGEQKEIAWGSQIRSYVLHPYSMVKDHRSLEETAQVDKVLDGDLDSFAYAYLQHMVGGGSDD